MTTVLVTAAFRLTPAWTATSASTAAALALQPESAEAHYAMGALAMHEAALEADPKHFRALNQIGVLVGNAGRREEAIEHFLEAIEIKPDYVAALYNLAMAYRQLGQDDLAILELERAAVLVAKDRKVRVKLEECYRSQGRQSDAERVRAELRKLR